MKQKKVVIFCYGPQIVKRQWLWPWSKELNKSFWEMGIRRMRLVSIIKTFWLFLSLRIPTGAKTNVLDCLSSNGRLLIETFIKEVRPKNIKKEVFEYPPDMTKLTALHAIFALSEFRWKKQKQKLFHRRTFLHLKGLNSILNPEVKLLVLNNH